MHKIDSAVITSCVYRTLHHGRPRALVQRGTVHERRRIGGLAIGRHGTPCAVLEPRAHRTDRHTPSAHTLIKSVKCVCVNRPARYSAAAWLSARRRSNDAIDERAMRLLRVASDLIAIRAPAARVAPGQLLRVGDDLTRATVICSQRRGAACSAAAITHVAKCDH